MSTFWLALCITLLLGAVFVGAMYAWREVFTMVLGR